MFTRFLTESQFPKRVLFIVVCLILFVPRVSLGAPERVSVDIDDELTQLVVGKQLAYSTSEKLSIESYLDAARTGQTPQFDWQESTSDVPSFGFDGRPHWFRLAINNKSTTPREVLLEVGYPVLDYLEIYLIHDNQLIEQYRGGDKFNFYDRPINHRNFVYKLPLDPTQHYEILIRVQTSGSLQLPLSLWEPQYFWSSDQRFLVGQGIFFGMMWVMVIYNFFLFLSVRDSNYLIYIFSVSAFALFQASLQGFTFQYLWPYATHSNDTLIALSLLGFGCAGSLFTIYFLRLNEHMRHVYYALYGVVLFCAVGMVAIWFIPYQYGIRWASMPSIPGCLLALYSGIWMWCKGHLHAKYFTLAWFFLLVASIVLALNKFGIVPRVFLTEFAGQIGAALEVVLLSFALGHRINLERHEKYVAQRQALENEKLARLEQEKGAAIAIKAKEDELIAQQKIRNSKAESEAKSRFLATMSHEIRTPMNGVLGMAQLLRKSELLPQQRQYVEVINNSGKALLTIINDILDYSKITAGQMQIESVSFHLETLIEECTCIFSLMAENKDIELIASVAPGIPANLKGDPTRIRQILLNLLGNAFKFTSDGFVQLRVSEDPQTSDKADCIRLRLAIQDSGIGISEEVVGGLFEAFKQADSSVTRNYGGTGLGLSISKQLCELMNGSIGVESTLGEGSTFWASIPFGREQTASPDNNLEALFVNKRLLIVDDSIEFCTALQEVTKFWGFDSVIAPNGPLALKKLKVAALEGRCFDMVSLDLHMPDMSGLEIARVMSEDVDLRAIPRLLLTAINNPPKDEELRALGISLAIQKPSSLYLIKDAFIKLSKSMNEEAGKQDVVGDNSCKLDTLNVLVVEDNPVNTIVIQGMLKKLGVKAIYVANGLEAVNQVKEDGDGFDIILMDCEMPTMDGYTATEKIRLYESTHGQRRCPIVALTANELEQHEYKSDQSGMDGYLAKPLILESLKAILNDYHPGLH